MLDTEVSRIVQVAQGEEIEVTLENITHVIAGLNAFTESE